MQTTSTETLSKMNSTTNSTGASSAAGGWKGGKKAVEVTNLASDPEQVYGRRAAREEGAPLPDALAGDAGAGRGRARAPPPRERHLRQARPHPSPRTPAELLVGREAAAEG